MLSMILALDKKNLLGDSNSSNGLPWHYSEDLQFYKEKTVNKKNIMGRKTYESIGRALPNRETIVLSTSGKNIKDAKVISNLESLIAYINIYVDEEVMLIGGKSLFQELFLKVNKIYLTKVLKEYNGDIYYPEFTLQDFKCISSKKGNNKDLIFEEWERVK